MSRVAAAGSTRSRSGVMDADRWRVPSLRGALLLAALGATLGTALDALHTHGGVTAYAAPVWVRMAWWTPLLFGAAFLGLGLLYSAWMDRSGADVRPSALVQITASGAFVLLYAASAFLPVGNGSKLLALGVGAIALWLLADGTWQGAAMAALAGALGVAAEATLVAQGAFRHLAPDVAGLPLWLPALYAAAVPALGPLARRLLHPPSAPTSSGAPDVGPARGGG